MTQAIWTMDKFLQLVMKLRNPFSKAEKYRCVTDSIANTSST